MSYILDSLKRSDQERTRGTVPDLQSQPLISSVPPVKTSSRYRGWLWLLLLVVTLYIGSQLLLSSDSDSQSQAQAQAKVQTGLQVAAPVSNVGVAPSAPATVQESVPPSLKTPVPEMINATESTDSGTEVLAVSASARSPEPLLVVAMPVKTTAAAEPEPTMTARDSGATDFRNNTQDSGDALGISPATMSSLSGVKVKLQPDTVSLQTKQVQPEPDKGAAAKLKQQTIQQPVPKPALRSDREGDIKGGANQVAITEASSETARPRFMPAATVVNSPPETAPQALAMSRDPYAGIAHIRQLPDALKRELPELRFSVHIYSDHAPSRMVKINGTTYRQGAGVERDLVLNEITRDGVIMTFKGERFWQLTR